MTFPIAQKRNDVASRNQPTPANDFDLVKIKGLELQVSLVIGNFIGILYR